MNSQRQNSPNLTPDSHVCIPVLDPLQLDVPAEDWVDDVIEDVGVLHPGLHHDLLPLGALGLHVVLPEEPLLLARLARRAAGAVLVVVRVIWNHLEFV